MIPVVVRNWIAKVRDVVVRQEELAHAHATELKETERAQQNALEAAVRIHQVRSQNEIQRTNI